MGVLQIVKLTTNKLKRFGGLVISWSKLLMLNVVLIKVQVVSVVLVT